MIHNKIKHTKKHKTQASTKSVHQNYITKI